MMLKAKQKGFTLLELLVVITLLAILSVGALVAYEGIGKNAQNVGAANNIAIADSAVRNYAALENVYPNQWDNLVNINDGTVNRFIAPKTTEFLSAVNLDALPAAVQAPVVNALVNAGLTEYQSLQSAATFGATAIPNEVWNESSPDVSIPADELELAYTAATAASPADVDIDSPAAGGEAFISVVANGASGAGCTVGGLSMATNRAATPATLTDSTVLNRINDVLGNDECHMVVAVGLGKDVPGTTLNSKVAISTAPTYVSDNINPSVNYARYIGLFHVGSAGDDTSAATRGVVSNFRNKAKLVAIVDTEGRNIDVAIDGAFEEEN